MSKIPKKQNKILFHLGNALMALSAISLLYTYFPYFMLFVRPPTLDPQAKKEFSIIIPKIRAQAPIVASVDPWNEQEYRQKLENGVAQAKGSALPGVAGITYLFAHSSDLPWRMTRYNTVFFRLGELQKNDEIIVYYKSKKYIYKVTEKKEVWPNEIQYLEKSMNPKRASSSVRKDPHQLILQTCTPVGLDYKRLLVFSEIAKN